MLLSVSVKSAKLAWWRRCGSRSAPHPPAHVSTGSLCRTSPGFGPDPDAQGGSHASVLRTGFGGPEVLVIREIPEPEPKEGYVVIQVKAFGLNHAELHMRKGEWAEIADVSGIECVGVVKSCPSGEFAIGTKVAALMGGLGRTINGSYAEYTRAPVTNVVAMESGLSWADLAAIPESYATAWTCLFRNLELTHRQTLVIRGAT